MKTLYSLGLCGLVAWTAQQAAYGQNVDPRVPVVTPRQQQEWTRGEDFRTPEPRSVFSRNDRPVDELDRPRVSGRNSHRGFEVRSSRGTFMATTSAEDAQLVEKVVGETWGSLNQLADHFTEQHKLPDFGLSAVQVAVDNQLPRGGRDTPVPVWIPGRFENRIVINVSEGRPSLDEQIPLLRAATAYVYMHVAEFDRQLPQWLSDGFAQAVVLKHDGNEGLDSIADVPLELLRGGQGIKLFRETPVELQERMLAAEQAKEEPTGNLVPFLLFADDAAHAPEFFDTLKATLAERQEQAPFTREEVVRRRQVAFEYPPSVADEHAPAYENNFARWSEHPDAGVPQFVTKENEDPELVEIERQLFVVLKLAQKVSAPPPAVKTANSPRTRIVEFTKNGPVERAPQANLAKPVQALKIADVPQLIAVLDNNANGWTTVDVDGNLILSEDRDTVEELVDRFRENVTSKQEKDRWVWNYQLTGGRTLAGWLEPKSKEDPTLVSHFEVRPRAPVTGAETNLPRR